MISEDRQAAGRAALAEKFTDLRLALRLAGEPDSQIVGSPATGDLNLDLGAGRLFYQGDAQSYADTQIEAWRKSPERFYMNRPQLHADPTHFQDHITKALHDHFKGRQIAAEPPDSPTEGGGFMLIYGIGLGLHLPVLFDEAPVRHFIVVEEHFEFLLHSLRLIDWVALLEAIEAKGQTLRFIIGKDSNIVSAKVHWTMRGRGFGLLDGSFLFRHYRSTMLDLAHQDFVENLPLLPVSIGFWEDEMVMLANATTNLARNEFHLLDNHRRLAKDVPAFLVGSGPSLDKSIETLRRYAGQAVIFSAGTALRPLLHNGIRPDFHCELENVYGSVQQLTSIARDFDLSGITLIASATVHPDMPPLFDRHIFYFRDSVCSTPLWAPDGEAIYGTAPTCTNLALRAAVAMAFREFYLFGVDLGTKDVHQHHSKDSMYKHDEETLARLANDPARAMVIPMPANFGGIAYTNQILHWARMMMAQAIDQVAVERIFNCCDGVQIPGTLPKLPGSVRVEAPPGRKAASLARLDCELAVKAPGELVPRDRFETFGEAVRRHNAEMRRIIRQARDEDWPFIQFYEALQRLLEEKGEDPFQPALRSINVGSVMMSFQVSYYFYRRLPEAHRSELMQVFLDALDARFAHALDNFDTLFAALRDEMKPAA